MGWTMLAKMAFRNIWRNKRRTFITAASVMFAIFFASSMRSLQEGAWGYLVQNVVGFHTGYLQVQNKSFLSNPTLDNAIPLKSTLNQLNLEEDILAVPRVENFGLMSFESMTKAVLVVGTDIEKENQLTELGKRVVEGEMISRPGQILLAQGIAEYLTLGVGDSVIILSQGRRAANAVGMYEVSGLVQFGSPELNNQISYLDISEADELFNMEGHVTSIVLDVEDAAAIPRIKEEYGNKLDSTLAFRDYEEVLPALMQAKELDKLSGRVIISVLYLLICFGIFGTIMMMIKERQYEFGILKAIGLHSNQLYVVILIESLLIAVLGALMGIALAVPVIFYFQEFPIQFSGDYAKVYEGFGMEAKLPFKLDFSILIRQALIIASLTSMMSLYAYFKIKNLRAVKAMRG